MITQRKEGLKPILESKSAIHLTAYLENKGDIEDLKSQLRQVISSTYETLFSVTNPAVRKKILAPLDNLLHDGSLLSRMKGNIGIFRTLNSFRVLNIPTELKTQCHVASSFHVKPLLKWVQTDRFFILLGVDKAQAHLYLGSQSSFMRLDSILLSEKARSQINLFSRKKSESSAWLREWLLQLAYTAKPKLFLAGDPEVLDSFLNAEKYKNVLRPPISPDFSQETAEEICGTIRQIIAAESRDHFEKALFEFRMAEEFNLVTKNIYEISKAAVKGQIKKLIIADGINIFGKIDNKTGNLSIHPFDLDHEDDDVLDDLAQTVLASGGEVLVAPKEAIPKGRPALAIVDHVGPALQARVGKRGRSRSHSVIGKRKQRESEVKV